MSKSVSKKAVEKELQRRLQEVAASSAPEFVLKDFCFDKQWSFINDPARFKTAVCSRRCLAKNTLVMTTAGPKPIQTITPNDYVYNEHGHPIKVLAVFDNGPKEVVEFLHNKKVWVKATKNHVFLTYDTHSKQRSEKSLEHFVSRTKIIRKEVRRDGGISVPYAYAIGALLGDGCSRQGNKSYISISSENSDIPNRVCELLKADCAKKQKGNNYTYNIYTKEFPEEYHQWCKGKYAHEKIVDIDRILSWDRQSRLAFLAGLIDTDGSVHNAVDGLQIDISMQAKPVIEAAQILFLDLWQVSLSILIDNRSKYKNGPVYTLRIKNNYFGKRILQDLNPYIITARKKWKSEYAEKLENNFVADRVGITAGQATIEPTYDLHVDSPTNLYLLANGLVTHNSGKSIACVADLLSTAITQKGDVLYLTLNRRTAKRIVWRELLNLNEQFKLKGKPDNTDLTLTLPNKNVIYLSGAKDEAEIEKLRGMYFRKVYIDEAQAFRPYIKDLIEDIIEPALTDYYGSLVLIGTPGPIPAGFFYEASHNTSWSNHSWTMQDNPFILLKSGQEPLKIIEETASRRGLSISSPSIQREYFGRWVKDTDSLVYHFNSDLNTYRNELPSDLRYVFGVDIGYRDADAIAVLGYSSERRCVYLVHEFIRTKQDITSLVEEIKRLKQLYDPVKIVMDAGALGKKIQEEIRLRHTLHTEAAEKARKAEFIALLNDDLRTGKLKAPPNSRFEEDSYLLQWDLSIESAMKVSSAYHSDICDSVLYAWRECRHFYEHEAAKPAHTPDLEAEELEIKLAEELERQKNKSDDFTDVNNWEDLGISDFDEFE